MAEALELSQMRQFVVDCPPRVAQTSNRRKKTSSVSSVHSA